MDFEENQKDYLNDLFDDEQPNSPDATTFIDQQVGSFNFGNLWLVGHGERTNANCGRPVWKKMKGCLNIEKHGVNTLDGITRKNQAYVFMVHNWCGKPDCPVCYKKGWAVRQAKRITKRIEEAQNKYSEQHGLAEHIIVGINPVDFGMNEKQLRAKMRRIFKQVGIIGGAVIPHAFRFDKDKGGWYFSPHFHVIGFIYGGYYKCRNCAGRGGENCQKNCNMFASRNLNYRKRMEEQKKTSWYIKVLPERKTIFGTAWYQLHHSSFDITKKLHMIVTWFGNCSYRDLKVVPQPFFHKCPSCGEHLIRIKYIGKMWIEGDVKNPYYRQSFFMNYYEDGKPVFEKVKTKHKSIAEARIQEDTITENELADFQAYAKVVRDNGWQSTCYLCHQPIHDIMEQRILDGRRKVHKRCLDQIKAIEKSA